MQEYLTSPLFNNNEASMLISLWSKTTREFQANFPFNLNKMCLMGCVHEDTHSILVCEPLYPQETRDPDIQYEHIFSENVSEQAAITK